MDDSQSYEGIFPLITLRMEVLEHSRNVQISSRELYDSVTHHKVKVDAFQTLKFNYQNVCQMCRSIQ